METLFDEERKIRLGGDLDELKKIQHRIIEECKSDDEIIHAIKLLINKRKQDPGCIQALIKTVFDAKRPLGFYITISKEIIEGKIYLESERLYIAEYIQKELGNDLEKAYEFIKDVPVETFTTISDKKRTEFLFEQIRLALLQGFLLDAEHFVRKVNKRSLDEEEREMFYTYVIMLRIREKNYIEAADNYLNLRANCRNIVLGSLYTILGNVLDDKTSVQERQKTLLTKYEAHIMNSGEMRDILSQFRGDVILDLTVIEKLHKCLQRHLGDEYEAVPDIGSDLERSIMIRNVVLVDKFMSTIYISELATLLNLTEDDLVSIISEMVNKKIIKARINQQEGTISFGKKVWCSDVGPILEKLILAENLINQKKIE